MRKADVVLRAVNACQRVRDGVSNEDSRIEFKSVWPEPQRVARRLGGHANSMRGEPILWVIGVDEATGAMGLAESRDPGDWYASVRARFDGVAPDLAAAVNFDYDGKHLCALLFDTDAAPYVVKNESGEGAIQYEVPWRDGTLVRSAKQRELLRLLAPLQETPSLEVLAATVTASASGDTTVEWRVEVIAFIEPPTARVITLPFHRLEVVLRSKQRGDLELTLDVAITPLGEYTLLDPMRIWGTSSEIMVGCPGRVKFTARGFDPRSVYEPDANAVHTVVVHLLPSLSEARCSFQADVLPAAQRGTARYGRWVLPAYRVNETPPDLSPRINLPPPLQVPRIGV